MYVLFVFLGLALLITIASLTALGLGAVQDKIEKKKREKLLKGYPELKLLLAEFMRLTNEHSQTCADCNSLKKDIDEWESKNHYFPANKKVDNHIEELKQGLWELNQLKQEQSLLVKKARKELELFWATNFPNLKEGKRIMWWYWDSRDIKGAK